MSSLLLPPHMGLVRPKAAGGVWTPADIATEGWWKFNNVAANNMWQESSQTTQTTSNTDPIAYVTDDSDVGTRHMIQTDAAEDLEYRSAGPGAYWDGVAANQGLMALDDYSALTAVSCWFAVTKENSGNFALMNSAEGGGGIYCGVGTNGNGSSIGQNSGTPIAYVDGTVCADRDDLYDFVHTAVDCVIEIRDWDMTSWTSRIALGSYSSNEWEGYMYEILLMTMTVADANRTDINTYMQAQLP